MKDHKIPGDEPDGITYIKRLQIYATGEVVQPASDDKADATDAVIVDRLGKLRFRIVGYENDDEFGPGVDVGADQIHTEISEFIKKGFQIPSSLVETQLDFRVKKPCCVVLKLIGDFWEFMPDPPKGQAVRTKKKHWDKRYRKLRHHLDKDGYVRAVSFYVQDVDQGNVDPRKNTRHGINLYVDFVDGQLRLPVIIDPDIENVGDDPTQ